MYADEATAARTWVEDSNTHPHDDARFYDRRQAYVPARGG